MTLLQLERLRKHPELLIEEVSQQQSKAESGQQNASQEQPGSVPSKLSKKASHNRLDDIETSSSSSEDDDDPLDLSPAVVQLVRDSKKPKSLSSQAVAATEPVPVPVPVPAGPAAVSIQEADPSSSCQETATTVSAVQVRSQGIVPLNPHKEAVEAQPAASVSSPEAVYTSSSKEAADIHVAPESVPVVSEAEKTAAAQARARKLWSDLLILQQQIPSVDPTQLIP